ncbi:hypothetical protein PENTCL1PPCAC_2659, partial [Pristionchus entomophagus]
LIGIFPIMRGSSADTVVGPSAVKLTFTRYSTEMISQLLKEETVGGMRRDRVTFSVDAPSIFTLSLELTTTLSSSLLLLFEPK